MRKWAGFRLAGICCPGALPCDEMRSSEVEETGNPETGSLSPHVLSPHVLVPPRPVPPRPPTSEGLDPYADIPLHLRRDVLTRVAEHFRKAEVERSGFDEDLDLDL